MEKRDAEHTSVMTKDRLQQSQRKFAQLEVEAKQLHESLEAQSALALARPAEAAAMAAANVTRLRSLETVEADLVEERRRRAAAEDAATMLRRDTEARGIHQKEENETLRGRVAELDADSCAQATELRVKQVVIDDHVATVRDLKVRISEIEEDAQAASRRFGDKMGRYKSGRKELEQRLLEQEEINDHLEQIVEELREEVALGASVPTQEYEVQLAAKDEAIHRVAKEVEDMRLMFHSKEEKAAGVLQRARGRAETAEASARELASRSEMKAAEISRLHRANEDMATQAGRSAAQLAACQDDTAAARAELDEAVARATKADNEMRVLLRKMDSDKARSAKNFEEMQTLLGRMHQRP